MNDVVKNFSTSRLSLVLFLGFVALLVRDLTIAVRKVKTNIVIDDIERFLRSNRKLTDPYQEYLVEKLEKAWVNEHYGAGSLAIIREEEWVDHPTNTLSP